MKLTTAAIDVTLPFMCHGKIAYTINHEMRQIQSLFDSI